MGIQKSILIYPLLLAMGAFWAALACQAQETQPVTDKPEHSDVSEEVLISERENVELVNDSNVAEAVSRRPDLQFDNITIDGERSSLSLDEIPADAVSELEVLRAVTADLDADSRGGSLNLSYSPAFLLKEPTTKAELYYQYNRGENTWNQGFSGSYGQSFDRMGLRLSVSQNNDHEIDEKIRTRWKIADEQGHHYEPYYMFLEYEEFWEIGYSANANLDFKISDKFHLFFRTTWDENTYEGYKPEIFTNYSLGGYPELAGEDKGMNNAQIERALTAWEANETEWEFLTGWVFKVENLEVDMRYRYSHFYYEEPDWFIIEFESPEIDLEYANNSQHFPVPITDAHAIANDPSQFEFQELLSEQWEDETTTHVAILNSKYEFELFGADSYFKAGVKWIDREKDQRSDSRIYTGYLGTLTMDTLYNDYGADSLVVDGFNYGFFPTLEDSRNFFAQNRSQFIYDERRSAEKGDPSTYIASEEILSGYGMLNFNFHRLRAILGFRVERTQLDYQAREVEIDPFGAYVSTNPRTGSNGYTNLFPSVHFRYFLGDKSTVIASWTGTIRRPWYGETVPYRSINYNSQSISEGNPSLDPTLYNNLDISYDYKLSDSSLISFEMFYKEVEDIVFWEVSEINSGVFNGFTLGSYENGPSAEEYGLRLILTQDFSEVADWMDGLSLLLKLSFQDSSTKYPGREREDLPVTYLPETIFEGTLTYAKGPFFGQLYYSYESRELQSVYNETWEDLYQDPGERLDLKLSYNLASNFRVFLDIDNLIRSDSTNFHGETDRPNTHAYRDMRFEFGIKYSR